MSSRAWLDLPEAPRADRDGVVAETTLRAELWPRLLAATRALEARTPGTVMATTDRARWLAVCAAIDAGDAAGALAGLAALEQEAGVSDAA